MRSQQRRVRQRARNDGYPPEHAHLNKEYTPLIYTLYTEEREKVLVRAPNASKQVCGTFLDDVYRERLGTVCLRLYRLSNKKVKVSCSCTKRYRGYAASNARLTGETMVVRDGNTVRMSFIVG